MATVETNSKVSTVDGGVDGTGDSTTVEVNRPGAGKVQEEEGKKPLVVEGQPGAEEGAEGDGTQGTEEGKEKPAATEGEEAEATTDLGEFKADDAEVLAKYDARYCPDGKISLEAFGKVWNANKAKAADKKGSLSPGDYAYLEKEFGVDKIAAERIASAEEALQQQQAQSTMNERFKITGGGPNYQKLIEFGRSTYTPEQIAAFNKDIDQGGVKMSEALELLMGRYTRVHPTGLAPKTQGGPGRREGNRQSSPARTTGGAGGAGDGAGAAAGWKTYDDYQQDFMVLSKQVRQLERGGDRAKLREAEAKLEALRAKGRNHKFPGK